jgi:hypothetical protein
VFVPVDGGFWLGSQRRQVGKPVPRGRHRGPASWDKFENLSGPCGGAPVTSCAPCGHGRTSTPVGVIEISRGSSEANTPGSSPPKTTGTPTGCVNALPSGLMGAINQLAAYGRERKEAKAQWRPNLESGAIRRFPMRCGATSHPHT